MTKIFKQLGRHWAACLAVVALLVVQAYCDLSLPDYTSKIVDTGIQQGGIESPVPDTVRDTTLQALELLMSEQDAVLAEQWYSAPDADGVRTLSHDATAAMSELENAFATPDIVLYMAAAQNAATAAGTTWTPSRPSLPPWPRLPVRGKCCKPSWPTPRRRMIPWQTAYPARLCCW